MMALTVRQPFASAIVAGVKPGDNRRRDAPLCVGQWIAIHAGATMHEDEARARSLWPECPSDLPLGAIVGAARFARTVDAADRPHDPWARAGMRYWLFDRVVVVPPIRASGSRGLWTLDNRICLPVMAAIAARGVE